MNGAVRSRIIRGLSLVDSRRKATLPSCGFEVAPRVAGDLKAISFKMLDRILTDAAGGVLCALRGQGTLVRRVSVCRLGVVRVSDIVRVHSGVLRLNEESSGLSIRICLRGSLINGTVIVYRLVRGS